MFITLEGIDGCGKTTQIARLADALRAQGHEVVCTREPGGSEGAEEIRSLLLKGGMDRWSPDTEILLFTAARRDHLERRIRPALEAGAIVLCDRFLDSTRAYQGQRDPSYLEKVDQLHALMIGDLPDLTLLLDMDPEDALRRSVARLSGEASQENREDRFEQAGLSFQRSLRKVYHAILQAEPDRVKPVSAEGSQDEVAARLLDIVNARLEMDCEKSISLL